MRDSDEGARKKPGASAGRGGVWVEMTQAARACNCLRGPGVGMKMLKTCRLMLT